MSKPHYKRTILARLKKMFNLPVTCTLDTNGRQYCIQVFAVEGDTNTVQQKIFDLEDELFPNTEYLLSPIVYTLEETKKYYPEMLRWTPKRGEWYWHYYIPAIYGVKFKISRSCWVGDCEDKIALKHGNIFKSKKAVLRAIKEIKELTRTIKNY